MPFEELHQHGAFDWIVSSDDINVRAAEIIALIKDLAPLSVRAMLDIIKSVEKGQFDRQHAQAQADQCSASEDLQEGLRAMREKRKPTFKNQ
jgi:enoyl-CoA hydratase/carnithine racemase